MSSGTTSGMPLNNHSSTRQNGNATSGYESNLSDKDYDTLNVLIMENEDGGASLNLTARMVESVNTRFRPEVVINILLVHKD